MIIQLDNGFIQKVLSTVLFILGCLNYSYCGSSHLSKPDSTTLPFETGFELRYGLGVNNLQKNGLEIKWESKRTIDFFMDFPLKGNLNLEMGFGFSQSRVKLEGGDLNYGNFRMKMLPKFLLNNKRLGIAFGGFLGFLNSDELIILDSGTELNFSKFYLGPEAVLSYRLLSLPHLRTYFKVWGNFSAIPILDIIEPNAEDLISKRGLFLQAALGFTFR